LTKYLITSMGFDKKVVIGLDGGEEAEALSSS